MAFEKYTTEQLIKWNKTLLVLGILALVVMCIALGIGLYQSSKNDNNTLIFLVPTVFGPLAIFPSIFAAMIGSEIKKRQKDNS